MVCSQWLEDSVGNTASFAGAESYISVIADAGLGLRLTRHGMTSFNEPIPVSYEVGESYQVIIGAGRGGMPGCRDAFSSCTAAVDQPFGEALTNSVFHLEYPASSVQRALHASGHLSRTRLRELP